MKGTAVMVILVLKKVFLKSSTVFDYNVPAEVSIELLCHWLVQYRRRLRDIQDL